MTTKSMVVREVGPLVLVVHPARAPLDADWDRFVHFCQVRLAEGPMRMLVLTEGGAPDAMQRAACRVLFERGPVPIAVVTDVRVVRGVVTAIGWFNPGIRAFAFNGGAGFDEALKYLGVDGALAERVLLEVRAMQRELATPGS
jgi:hypothetical protein